MPIFRIVLIIILSPIITNAQGLYPLHPMIGDTLDAIEKKDYSLFPKINNSNLNYCLIYIDSSRFRLKAIYKGDSSSTFDLSHNEIVEAQQNIEKINEYYKNKDKPTDNYSKSVVRKRQNSKLTSPLLQQSEITKQAQKDARMHMRIEADQQRQKEHEKGLRPNNLHIEFK